jgi:putative aldouronate transport system substrate-binding protein
MNYGIEGVHYDMVDGKPTFKPELLAKDNFKTILYEAGIQSDIGFVQDFEHEKQWLTPIAIKGMKLYEDNNYCIERFPDLTCRYNPDELKRYSELSTPIFTYVSEMVQKWLLKAVNIEESYDEFIAQLEKLNIKELIELQNTVYQRYLNQ